MMSLQSILPTKSRMRMKHFSDEKSDADEAFSDEKPDEDEAFSDETGAFAVQPVSITSAVSTAVIFFLKISLLTLYILAHR